MSDTVLDRAHRIHQLLSECYWLVRDNEQLRSAHVQMDIDIHEIIADYERRGMR